MPLIMLAGCADKENKPPQPLVISSGSVSGTSSLQHEYSEPVNSSSAHSSVAPSSSDTSAVVPPESSASVSSQEEQSSVPASTGGEVSAPEQSSQQSAVSTSSQPVSSEPPEIEPVTVVYNNDPLNKSTITFDGKSIIVRGIKGRLVAGAGGNSPDMDIRTAVDGGETVYTLTPYSYDDSWKFGSFMIYDENRHGNPINIANVGGAAMFPDVSEVLNGNRSVMNSVTELSPGQTAQYITLDGSTANAAAVWSKIEEISDEICEGIDSDYDKLRAISRWVSDNIYYDNPIYSAGAPKYCLSLEYMLNNKSSICGGYSNMTSALCAVQGIRCFNISGVAALNGACFQQGVSGQFHEWNVAEIDGRSVIVDPGWNSSNYFNADGTYSTGLPRYRYFDIGEEVFALNHKAQKAEYRDYPAVIGG